MSLEQILTCVMTIVVVPMFGYITKLVSNWQDLKKSQMEELRLQVASMNEKIDKLIENNARLL